MVSGNAASASLRVRHVAVAAHGKLVAPPDGHGLLRGTQKGRFYVKTNQAVLRHVGQRL